MQFIDEAEILVKAGDGGPGAVAFRREKYAPRGGPSGGDGGNGGDIVLQTDERLTTLLDFRFKREYRARNGEPGRGRDQNGHAAAELLLKVPPGTVVKDAGTGELLADLRENARRWVLAKGGRGGLGNMNFATSTLQAPRFAQPGTEGEEKRVRLELRLLADVGLVGFPNAGKSTLVSRLSRARPKIADYPFTTLQPHLGVVQYRDGRSFVLSDLPGLIEGAHRGAGLGHRFLKHMARCRAIIHLIDASQDRDLATDFDAINRELELFDPALRRKPQIVAANKIDIPEARERAHGRSPARGRARRRSRTRARPFLLVAAHRGAPGAHRVRGRGAPAEHHRRARPPARSAQHRRHPAYGRGTRARASAPRRPRGRRRHRAPPRDEGRALVARRRGARERRTGREAAPRERLRGLGRASRSSGAALQRIARRPSHGPAVRQRARGSIARDSRGLHRHVPHSDGRIHPELQRLGRRRHRAGTSCDRAPPPARTAGRSSGGSARSTARPVHAAGGQVRPADEAPSLTRVQAPWPPFSSPSSSPCPPRILAGPSRSACRPSTRTARTSPPASDSTTRTWRSGAPRTPRASCR